MAVEHESKEESNFEGLSKLAIKKMSLKKKLARIKKSRTLSARSSYHGKSENLFDLICIDYYVIVYMEFKLGDKIFRSQDNVRMKIFDIVYHHGLNEDNGRPPSLSELTPKTTKTRVVCYAIIQSPQWFSELTHSSSEASKLVKL